MKKTYSTILKAISMAIAVCMLFSFGAVAAADDTVSTDASAYTPFFTYEDAFTSRDLKQEANLTDAVTCTVSDGQDIHITAAGVYVLTGTASNVTVYVEAGEDDKVQIVLDGVTVINTNLPVIYAKTADKVFVTTSGDSTLTVTGTFSSIDGVNTDGVIFSKTDLVLNGIATLTVSSTENGVVGKDDLKITGGTYNITARAKAIEANDSIRIAGGTLNLTAGTDGLHAENDNDNTKGYVYIADGTITINAGDDGIHATTVAQIDGGELTITAAEGIEATYIQINDGTITISGKDDGVNAAQKSSAYRATVEINGGNITIAMASGDTDGVDSNGDIIITGGTINVTGSSSFDYDGTATFTGGTIIVNGQQLSYIPNQFMGGMGGMGGNMGGMGRQNDASSAGGRNEASSMGGRNEASSMGR